MKIGRLDRRHERGAAFVTTIILAAVLLTIAVASLIYSRSDAMVSSNSESGSEALWIAHLGAERTKDWLRKFDPATSLSNYETVTSTPTVRHNAETYAGQPGATYTTSVALYPGTTDRFLIDSTGTGPDGSSARIQEVVALAAISLNPAAINIQGTGTHTQLSKNNIGIPNYYIDGRDHDRHGTPCGATGTTCGAATVPAIAGTQAVIETNPTNVKGELTALRREIVQNGNACNANGTNCNGRKQAGLYWAKTRNLSTSSTCVWGQTDPASCPTNLDLRAPHLNAVNHLNGSPPAYPSATDTTWAFSSDMFWGPIVGPTPPTEVQVLSAPQDLQLQQLIQQILEFALASDVPQREAISAHLTSNRTFGSWESPVIAIVCDSGHPNATFAQLSSQPPCNGNNAPNNLDVDNSTIIGTGILIVSRAMLVDDATFNWRGIVLILNQGRLEVKATGGSADACGMILGTALLQDDTGADPKIKLLDTADTDCANPFTTQPSPTYTITSDVASLHGFGVKYSDDAIRNALTSTLLTLAWNEVYSGE